MPLPNVWRWQSGVVGAWYETLIDCVGFRQHVKVVLDAKVDLRSSVGLWRVKSLCL